MIYALAYGRMQVRWDFVALVMATLRFLSLYEVKGRQKTAGKGTFHLV
jgi:hypothetical protein